MVSATKPQPQPSVNRRSRESSRCARPDHSFGGLGWHDLVAGPLSTVTADHGDAWNALLEPDTTQGTTAPTTAAAVAPPATAAVDSATAADCADPMLTITGTP